MPTTGNTEAVRAALLALVAAAEPGAPGDRLLRRLLIAAVANENEPPPAAACACRAQLALVHLGRTLEDGAASLRRRADVTAVAETFELAAEKLEVLEDGPVTGEAPRR